MFAWIALGAGYFELYPAWHVRWGGIQTQGTVINVFVCDHSGDSDATLVRPYLALDTSTDVTAEIVFTDLHGHKQDVWEYTCGNYAQDHAVTVWYLPNDPQTFTTDQQFSSTYFSAAIVGVAGILLLTVLVRMLLYFLPRRQAPPLSSPFP
jgi:hypothetical protein